MDSNELRQFVLSLFFVHKEFIKLQKIFAPDNDSLSSDKPDDTSFYNRNLSNDTGICIRNLSYDTSILTETYQMTQVSSTETYKMTQVS